MSCESDTAGLLRASGYKLTPQRMLILSTLRHSGGHQTAHQIFDVVRQSYPFVDVSTVYRTLTTLKRLRLVAETDMGSGDYSYEWLAPDSHHHLICRLCNTTTEIDGSRLQTLRSELLAEHGFAADLDHFAIVGVCADCRAAAAADTDDD